MEELEILLVDDDLALLDAMRVGLTRYGHEITPAVRADDAIYFIQSKVRYDCIVTDLDLPGSGVSIIRSAQQEAQTPPILVLTSSSDEALLAKAEEAGATAVINKPVTIRQLNSHIRHAVLESG